VGVDQLDGWEALWQRLGDRIDQEHTVASHH
jgi:hypothetical protein